MAFLPADEGKVGEVIVFHKDAKPSADGTMVFLNANPDLAEILARVEKAGGKAIVPKTHINPEIGYFAVYPRYRRQQNRTASAEVNRMLLKKNEFCRMSRAGNEPRVRVYDIDGQLIDHFEVARSTK